MANLKGKAGQKKKPGDFKRPKRKVGRKVTPSNVTNASITSRRINITEQSVLQDKTGAAVTHRNQTLQDILSKMSHYNAHVRRDALFALKELVGLHGMTLVTNVGIVVERVLQAMMDDEAVVREACVGAWKGCLGSLTSTKSESVLEPFTSLIAVYFCSGLTHIKAGVREDALEHIDALLDLPVCANLLARCLSADQCGQLLENLKDLVSPKQTTVQVKNSYSLLAERNKAKQAQLQTQVLKGRFFAVAAAHKFLRALAFQAPSASTSSSTVASVPSHPASGTVLLFPAPQFVGWSPTPASAVQNAAATVSAASWATKAVTLLRALLALWMEAHDESANLSQEALMHMVLIADCATMLVHEASAHIDSPTMKAFQSAFFEDFPKASPDPLRIDISTLHHWNALNLAMAQFGCECLRTGAALPGVNLDEMIAAFLAAELKELQADKESSTIAHSASSMKTRLDILLLLLERQPHPALLASFTALYTAAAPQSAMFRTCTSFVLQYLTPTLNAAPGTLLEWDLILTWMQQMGNFLQLPHAEAHHDATLAKVFRVCIAILKRLPAAYHASPALASWLSRVMAFFTETTETNWVGSMSPSTQIEAASCLYHLPSFPSEFLKTLALCCKSPCVSVDAKSFLVDIVATHEGRFERGALLSFYLSTLFAPTNQGIAAQVCRVLTWMSLGASLSSILAPILSKQSVDDHALPLVLAYVACLRSSTIVFRKAGQELEKRPVPDVLRAQVTSVFAHVLTAPAPTSLLLPQVVDGLLYCNGAFVDLASHFFRAQSLVDALGLLREARLRPLVLLYKVELQAFLADVDVTTADANVVRQIRNELQLITKDMT
ncbi:hypothetical protein SPRG_10337 [Saprolegnia parasitica CBS 223.65]|uniref:Pre-rRNA-processing protein Ipi1 N-terminal domain-containing protein n=1 Tax=Saprolegnia parasitica (strain CBS 223.65) TaxID=695850 RepID=A0A067CCH0_SAPPC|nr:hypothetical protein SPRG_10337 [Saprolegnia parasitica CBS 223.65]KDO24522.1 hypothetical protein SPRG_10337 [Saprolegnia parasitica CBS 223.65]|eukprot:XP_012204784.1 hypothetical protein SPRG_10337 [Saprolegnia parasitica CBS 223.65]